MRNKTKKMLLFSTSLIASIVGSAIVTFSSTSVNSNKISRTFNNLNKEMLSLSNADIYKKTDGSESKGIDQETATETKSSFTKAIELYSVYGNNLFAKNFDKENSKLSNSKPGENSDRYRADKSYNIGFNEIVVRSLYSEIWVTKAFIGNVATAFGATSASIGSFLTAIGILILLKFWTILQVLFGSLTIFSLTQAVAATSTATLIGATSATAGAGSLALATGAVTTGTAASVKIGALAAAGITKAAFIANLLMVFALITGVLFAVATLIIMSKANNSDVGIYFQIDHFLVSSPITAMATLREQNKHETTPRVLDRNDGVCYSDGEQEKNIRATDFNSGFLVGDWYELDKKFDDQKVFSGIFDISKFTSTLSHRYVSKVDADFYIQTKNAERVNLDVEFNGFLRKYFNKGKIKADYLYLVLDKKTRNFHIGGSEKTSDKSYNHFWSSEKLEKKIDFDNIEKFGFNMLLKLSRN